MDRRHFLRLAGGAAGAAALAACGSDGPSSDFVASRLFDSRALQVDGTPQRMVWAVQRDGSYVADELADVPDSWTQFAGWSPDGRTAVVGRGWQHPQNVCYPTTS